MTGEQTIELFQPTSKPDLKDITEYLLRRLHGNENGISVSHDSLGNTVFQSLGKQEDTLFEPHPATLVVSANGKKLISENPGLLHRISAPNPKLEKIGEGSEGKVYKISLNFNGKRQFFALKYNFPIQSPSQSDQLFTPGIDQMRLMQLAEKEKPLPHLHIVSPILASIDFTIAPYIGDAIQLKDFEQLFYRYSEAGNEETFGLSPRMLQMVERMRFHDASTDQAAEKILPVINRQFFPITKGLGTWVIKNDKLPFTLISHTISSTEPEGLNNYLISIPQVWSLFQECMKHPEITHSATINGQAMRDKVQECCYLIELTLGSRAIPV